MSLHAAIAVLLSALVAVGCHSVEGTGPAPRPVAQTVELPFWLPDTLDPKTDPRIVEWDGHPCGAVAYLRLTRIVNDLGGLGSEMVIEFDAKGDEAGLWRVPVDTTVEAIRGDLLGILVGPRAYWVDRDGALFERRSGGAASTGIPCPPTQRFADSPYLHCLLLTDHLGGASRRIAAPEVCS